MRRVIVTGGSRGLGLGIARTLRASGHQVVAIARRDSPELSALLNPAADGGGTIHFRAFDLADIDAIPQLVRGLRQEFGAFHGLVNNAGIGSEGLLSAMRTVDIERTLRLNTLSPIVLTKHVVRTMMADPAGPGRTGRIINVASIVGHTGYSGLSVYAASKAALVGFTRSLARELGTLGITVNAVAPGFVDTEMTQGMQGSQRDQIKRRSALKRMASIDDVAHAVDYLMGDKARNVTGTVMTVDAGTTA